MRIGNFRLFAQMDIFQLYYTEIVEDLPDLVPTELRVFDDFLELGVFLFEIIAVFFPGAVLGQHVDWFGEFEVTDIIGLPISNLILDFSAERALVMRKDVIFAVCNILWRSHFLIAPFCDLSLIPIMKYRENFPCFEIITIGYGVPSSMNILGVVDFAWRFICYWGLNVHPFDLLLLNNVILDTDLIFRLVHNLLEMLPPLAIAKRGIEVEVVNLVPYQAFELSFGLHVQRIGRNAHSP